MFEDIFILLSQSASFPPLFTLKAYFSCLVFTLYCGNCCTTLPLKDCSTFKFFFLHFPPVGFLKRGREKEASMTEPNKSEDPVFTPDNLRVFFLTLICH